MKLHTLFVSTLGAAMVAGTAFAASGGANGGNAANPATSTPAHGNAAPQGSSSATQGSAAPQSGATAGGAKANAGETTLSRADRTFLENAVQGSHAEIEGSKMAQEKSQSAEVEEFAAAMIKDHTAMIKEVTALAQLKGYTPPDGPSVMQRTELTALGALTGNAFDKMYVDRLGIASHEATIEQFEAAAKDADDPEVKALAEKTLPKLKHHLEMAQALNEKQKAN